jgi:lipopolysaccharide assembly protein B
MNIALDWTWLLLLLPLSFGMGWLASRLDLRQLKLQHHKAPTAYFKGLHHLLNEQEDQAIDAFIEAVQNDPDTAELHFALGNLFRRRGEFERAIRVHEHLLSRADTSKQDRDRAQHALSQDFLKAGLLDRAETALKRLEGTIYQSQARLARLAIYERSREWHNAAHVAQDLHNGGVADFSTRIAQYHCEMAQAAFDQQNPAADQKALQDLRQALSIDSHAARPRLMRARWLMAQGQSPEALRELLDLFEQSPRHAGLGAAMLVKAAQQSQGLESAQHALEALNTHYKQQPSLDVLEALMALASEPTRSQDRYLEHLRHEPSLMAVKRWLSTTDLARIHPEIIQTLEKASKRGSHYRCAACGFEAQQYFWQCPGCQSWDSYPPQRIEEL